MKRLIINLVVMILLLIFLLLAYPFVFLVLIGKGAEWVIDYISDVALSICEWCDKYN